MCSFRHMGAARNYSIHYCLRRVIKRCSATERKLRECTELDKTECSRSYVVPYCGMEPLIAI